MSPTSSRSQRSQLSYGLLAPFALLALHGLLVLAGWWSGNVWLVQPRSYDAVLPVNAAACFVLIGLSPVLFALKWRRSGLALGFIASGLGLITLLEALLEVDFGLDDLLARPEALVAGPHVGRMLPALAVTCTLAALLITWLAVRPRDTRLPPLLGLVGSLVLAYALTSLLA